MLRALRPYHLRNSHRAIKAVTRITIRSASNQGLRKRRQKLRFWHSSTSPSTEKHPSPYTRLTSGASGGRQY